MNARYYNQGIGRFLSQDPVHLAVGNNNSLKAITNRSLQEYLSDPQAFNSYSYTRNNPLRYTDKGGEFFGEPGRGIASGQRNIASYLNQAADQTSSRGGFFNWASGAVTHAVADTFTNAANVFDPDQKGGTRLMGLGLLALDAYSGGESKGVVTPLKGMKIVPTAAQKLDKVSSITKLGTKEILEQASGSVMRFSDNANNQNVNIFINLADDAKKYIRVTLDPTQNRIISSGINQVKNVLNNIEKGRFTPLK